LSIKQAIQSKSTWTKVIRYGLKPLAWIAVGLVVVWGILWIYVVNNEEALIKRVSNAIQLKTRGEVKIEGLSVSFFRTFPLLSLQLENIVIRDSVAAFPHRDFLKASDVYLRISIPELIKGKAPIGKVLIRNGEINIATDSAGNTNEYILRTKPREGRATSTNFPDLELQNVSIKYVNPKRKKDYSAIVSSIKVSAKDNDGKLTIRVNMNVLAKNLSFNTIRGAYLKEKMVEGKFILLYNRVNKDLHINNIILYLDNQPFNINGKFNLDNDKGDFNLDIRSRKVMFTKASSLLTDRIQKALKPYSVLNPVELRVSLSGKTVYRSEPLVIVNMNVRNAKVITPQGIFEDCSFDGTFTNEMVRGKDRDDLNSYLLFEKFTGRWENIVLRSNSIKIANLIKPFLECDVASDVDMKTLNALANSKTFEFQDGKISFKIDFKGPVYGGDSLASNINGFVNIAGASIKYNPRNILLSHCNGNLKFVNNDLFVNKLNASVGKTKLLMNGSAENFLSLLNVSPEKLTLKWKINSPDVHLDDFKTLLSSSSKNGKSQAKKSTIAQTSARIDKMFADGDMYISLETPSMDYKTFRATSVKADVVFTPTEIRMSRVTLNHAGGSMSVMGQMKNETQKNPVSLHVAMQNMDVPQLFTAFNNFGQDAITNKNLKGKLSADINFNTSVTNKAALVSQDSEGNIAFLLAGGELNNFEPLQEISKKVFKKQDFSQIKFADLKNSLDVKGTTFIINSMDIRSTALNFTVEGIYDFKKGTDMFIKLPLRNLLKSQANTDISDDGKPARGVSVRLRAKTGDDGKLKISWDPLRLGKRNKKEVKDSADLEN
jgi:hypothetical protein